MYVVWNPDCDLVQQGIGDVRRLILIVIVGAVAAVWLCVSR